MYSYKIILILQDVFNLSLLIQNNNFAYRTIAHFHYYNVELEDYKRACLSRYNIYFVLQSENHLFLEF